MSPLRQVFAFSATSLPAPGQQDPSALIEHAIGLARSKEGRRRACYLPTASGDAVPLAERMTARLAGRADVDLSVLRLFPQPSVPNIRTHLLSQDLLLVEGGSVVNLLAVWRAHGLAEVLRECWDSGVLLAGWGAGSLCWHRGGVTESFSDALDAFTDGLGFLPYSNGVHDDIDGQPRRHVFRRLVAEGALPAGFACEDGVGLHYTGTDLGEAVTIAPGKHAWWVEPAPRGGFRQQPVDPRPI